MLAIHTLWGAPVLIVVIVGLLYQQLGWATFVGLVVVAIYSPISSRCPCGWCGVVWWWLGFVWQAELHRPAVQLPRWVGDLAGWVTLLRLGWRAG